MKILITGASGFAGTHLVEYLRKNRRDLEILALVYGGAGRLGELLPPANIVELDLLENDRVEEIIKSGKPNAVIHLAAIAAVGKSFKEPQLVIRNNLLSSLNILEAVRKFVKSSRVLLIGSADEYGSVEPGEVPISEETPLRPTSPYAVSKVSVDFLGFQYHLAYQMDVVRLRPFNHIGEYQAEGFVVSDFAKQIVEVELEKKEEIRVGNLSAVRDFTDVKDMVQAYSKALEKCQAGEVYNIGSGKGVRIQDLLNIMISLSQKEIRVEVDSKLYRPVDIETIVSNPSKFEKTTGWKARTPLEATLRRVLHYWRNKIINTKE